MMGWSEFTLSGPTTSQWNGLVCFLLEPPHLRGNGGGAGGAGGGGGTLAAAGPDPGRGERGEGWAEAGEGRGEMGEGRGEMEGRGVVVGGWGAGGWTGAGMVSGSSGPTSGADILLLGLGTGF